MGKQPEESTLLNRLESFLAGGNLNLLGASAHFLSLIRRARPIEPIELGKLGLECLTNADIRRKRLWIRRARQ